MQCSSSYRIAALVIVCTSLGAPAAAEPGDAAYCAQLAALALRYTGTAGSNGGLRPNSATAWAVEQCGKGNAAAGIPVLEMTLRDNRFTLPSR